LPILPTHKPLEPAVVKPEAERSVISAPLSNAVSPIQPPVATAVKSAEKKSELNEDIIPKPRVKQLPGRPVLPAEKEKNDVKHDTVESVKQDDAIADAFVESSAAKNSPPLTKKSSKPTLEAITEDGNNIRLLLSNMKTEPKVLRESKNKRIVIKLPGVYSSMRSPNHVLNSLGFERARVARHNDGIWVVLHSSGQRLPNVETRVTAEGLTILAAAPVAAVAPPLKIVKRKSAPRIEPVVAALPSQSSTGSTSVSMATIEQSVVETPTPLAVEKDKPAQRQQVAVTTTTTSNEQALYRSGVAAYKSGNCSEAIKQLSSFIASYPDSVFAGDAAIYRSDCIEKK